MKNKCKIVALTIILTIVATYFSAFIVVQADGLTKPTDFKTLFNETNTYDCDGKIFAGNNSESEGLTLTQIKSRDVLGVVYYSIQNKTVFKIILEVFL